MEEKKAIRNFYYDLVCPTSMGVRITPTDRQPVHTSDTFTMKATSAESNVLNVSASLGLNAMVMTKFVADSPVAWLIKSDLRARNISYLGAEVPQGGAWGYRHQINVADSGFGMRGPRVWNDRAGEVGRTIALEDFDIQDIFEVKGVNIIHMSGLFAALSPETSKFCVELARVAKKSGTRISFDLNYRASFWKGREEELSAAFSEIASLADILIGNEEDFQLALGIQGPEAGGSEIGDKIESFKQMILRVQASYPNATTYATTLRQVLSANEHMWGAILYAGGQWYVEEPREIHVYDRIGGGDGFVSGLLYAILKGWDCQKWLQFGWASGALATTMIGDYATPVDEDQVFSIYQGNARVKR